MRLVTGLIRGVPGGAGRPPPLRARERHACPVDDPADLVRAAGGPQHPARAIEDLEGQESPAEADTRGKLVAGPVGDRDRGAQPLAVQPQILDLDSRGIALRVEVDLILGLGDGRYALAAEPRVLATQPEDMRALPRHAHVKNVQAD